MGGIGKWNTGKSSWVKNNNAEIPVPANQGWKTKVSITKEEYKTSKARTYVERITLLICLFENMKGEKINKIN